MVWQHSTLLPIELLGIVAEHLIGQHAFGTAGSLNRTSRAVHHETLPVLYETVFLEHYQRLRHYERGGALSKGTMYTR